ncbi:tRNA (adenosine(37)-N6)-threonylcarbamoyltransferase complex dimerization subunit type 1 TsaB [Chitinophagaceae bacterium LB-8]|uniref:tRNA (Adenosine(37)-N6)-threonylcarbamoyltransferase complex dimerization subunit type 1 TsaB n=1 Tax=Paraflavisolibacter caeni TaxID=2982496 RepID=A0A9X2XY34_9BACT|nr:tRNA (adenosine(37)-N6)-threonylcarbamoyltransferase complex dimerization subunit type 1 TsaB [Paraflavisolibacter caeni]MCU7551704.1 tRNA (adenosine(37)-N6)-threonylcarbamoyltransferase complex dimerization subunit type 1 TsaB [Paraflavisolibacter caeni]
MSLILNIDTAVQTASVCLSRDGENMGLKINPSQKDHAAWLHIAINDLLQQHSLSLSSLDAIAVSAGPGSYTGLRVGMATAKGLCYALNLPLITVGTLQMMAMAAVDEPTDLLCPMIDARRMEVFTATYNKSLTEVILPSNIILTETYLLDLLENNTITFFGNGSTKFLKLINNNNAIFKQLDATAEHLAKLSNTFFIQQKFSDLAYSEPFYGKEFYSPAHNV